MLKTSGVSELRELSRDSGIFSFVPKVAYTAETEGEVAVCMRDAASNGLTVTARGGGTSIPSQAVGPGAILLQARRRVEVRSDGLVECEPGIVKADLNTILSTQGRWMPVDPSSKASCTVGGMVANNSSGVRTMKYGSTIDYVKTLRVVIPGESPASVSPVPIEDALSGDQRTKKVASLVLENHELIESDRPRVTKNSSGYRLEKVVHDGMFDLPRLFVGSEGTLSVFTEATFATRSPPKWRLLFIVESTLEELNNVANAFRAHSPSGLELVDKSVFRVMNRWETIAKYSRTDSPYLVFCEFDGYEGDPSEKAADLAGSRVGGYDPAVISSPAEISEAWEARSEVLNIAQDIRKGSKTLVPGVEDLTVPADRLADLVKLLIDEFGRRGLEYISYGHAGDANLHARPLVDISERSGRSVLDELMDDCFEAVWKMGGTMTGEHGDGMLRARYVEKQYPKTYWIMKEIKSLFDPAGILNPGVKIAP